jgi:hypothetical protein
MSCNEENHPALAKTSTGAKRKKGAAKPTAEEQLPNRANECDADHLSLFDQPDQNRSRQLSTSTPATRIRVSSITPDARRYRTLSTNRATSGLEFENRRTSWSSPVQGQVAFDICSTRSTSQISRNKPEYALQQAVTVLTCSSGRNVPPGLPC